MAKFYASPGTVAAFGHVDGSPLVADFGTSGSFETSDPYLISHLQRCAENPLDPVTDQAPAKPPPPAAPPPLPKSSRPVKETKDA